MIRPVRFAIVAFLVLGVLTVGAAMDWTAPTRTEVPAIELRAAPLPGGAPASVPEADPTARKKPRTTARPRSVPEVTTPTGGPTIVAPSSPAPSSAPNTEAASTSTPVAVAPAAPSEKPTGGSSGGGNGKGDDGNDDGNGGGPATPTTPETRSRSRSRSRRRRSEQPPLLSLRPYPPATAMMTTTRSTVTRATTAEATTTRVTTVAETTARAVQVSDAQRRAAEPVRFRDRLERVRWVPSSLRARIVAWFIAVLALSTLALVVVTYQVLGLRLDQRIDADLRQEAAELRVLAEDSLDPSTGKPFANVRRIFDVYLARNVPSRNEAFITFLAGEPYLRSRPLPPYRLDTDPELVARWAGVRGESERGAVSTPAGRVEYLAIPLKAGGETGGVFVAAAFRDRSMDEAEDSAIMAAGLVGIIVLLLGSLLAWRLADRVVQPVTALTRTARSISETDLSARIPARGRDEVAQLATTFNEMLDRLERAFAAQRRFADDASHELKTPLTIVRGHLELLDDDPVERNETLLLVTDELDRMGRIVEDLLLLARREEPDFLSLATVDVGDLTDALLSKAKALAPRDWVLDVRGQGVIVADRQRLVQAVVQLAENAARYSPDGPIAIGSIVSGGEARFWIRDHGPGIPEHERSSIFERFRRGADTGRTDGAGLGLAIVKAIAEAHKGRVELESSAAGSVFSIVVPVDQPQAEIET